MLLFHDGQGNACGFGRCEAAEAAMRAHEAVVVAPGGQYRSSMGQATEEGLVETFVAQAPDDALDEPVLLRLAWRDVVPVHVVLLAPSVEVCT